MEGALNQEHPIEATTFPTGSCKNPLLEWVFDKTLDNLIILEYNEKVKISPSGKVLWMGLQSMATR